MIVFQPSVKKEGCVHPIRRRSDQVGLSSTGGRACGVCQRWQKEFNQNLRRIVLHLYHQQNILRKPTMVTHLHVGRLQSRDCTGGSDAIMMALVINASRYLVLCRVLMFPHIVYTI